MSNNRIGIDVGGSHISAAVIHNFNGEWKPGLRKSMALNSYDSAIRIVRVLGDCIKELSSNADGIEAVGIAFPGPFDYENGISAVFNVGGKFEQIFGLHIKQVLEDYAGLKNTVCKFSNDANGFAIGAYNLHGLQGKRIVFITLGTGFGSAFMSNGELIDSAHDIPASGAFFNQKFMDDNADEYFSSRWILNEYQRITGKALNSVKEMVEAGSPEAFSVMRQFGENLGRFLLPWLKKFQCDELVIGGNIAKAFSLFGPSLITETNIMADKLNTVVCDNTEDCIILGAAILADKEKRSDSVSNMRKTLQELLPVTVNPTRSNSYDIYPSFASGKKVLRGFDSLADEISEEKVVVIDGYGGVLWETFRERLHEELIKRKKTIFWYNTDTCLKPADDILDMISVSLNGDDPVFGSKYPGSLSDFFDEQKLKRIKPDQAADLCIIYGTGAALTGVKGKLLYLDVPKNEIQFRMRAGSISNLGTTEITDNQQMYKRLYFVDWPVLNKHKAALLPHIDYIIDEQRIDEITWMNGPAFRSTLNQMLKQPFRARPWFEAGIWGGDWMKQQFPQLNQEERNYAWSFELITPENGIVIEGEKNLLEVSFDYLLYSDNNGLLGKAAKRFGTEFPIRFDFLDTYNGGNLSVQCHPRPGYIKEHFGENFTQDETYYILDCEPDAVVYLGFQDSINPEEFTNALINAQENSVEINVEKYVQKLPAHKHDLFLIPNGTIHASGKNNLVLEISSTPYIFTFKMYDWLRFDLSNQPRPINIGHGMKNVYFDRKGDYVNEKLVSHPVTIEEFPGGKMVNLPTHEEHFYRIDRLEFTGSVHLNTNDQCHVCMLVEGETISLTANGTHSVFHFAETFVIPAATGAYEITNKGNSKAFVVVAHVKDECC
jgi:predicted NBD/HSP70 family sugar kinase/mannose-6-phosphate isomerase class I